MLVVFTLLFLMPILYTVVNTFKPASELYQARFSFLPHQWTTASYQKAFGSGNFLIYIWNSLFVAVIATVITVIINAMSGYAPGQISVPRQ